MRLCRASKVSVNCEPTLGKFVVSPQNSLDMLSSSSRFSLSNQIRRFWRKVSGVCFEGIKGSVTFSKVFMSFFTCSVVALQRLANQTVVFSSILRLWSLFVSQKQFCETVPMQPQGDRLAAVDAGQSRPNRSLSLSLSLSLPLSLYIYIYKEQSEKNKE